MEFWEFWRDHWEYIIQGGVLVMENLVSRGPRICTTANIIVGTSRRSLALWRVVSEFYLHLYS